MVRLRIGDVGVLFKRHTACRFPSARSANPGALCHGDRRGLQDVLTGIDHHPRKLTALVVAVACSGLICALWAGAATAARGKAAAQGQIEICKSAFLPDGHTPSGAAGQSFDFTLTQNSGGITSVVATASVAGGSCSDAIGVTAKATTITETANPDWAMAGDSVIPDSNYLSDNPRTGTVKVAVQSGQETQVTIYNAPSAATLKVCKWSASGELQGNSYSFTVSRTGHLTAIAGSSADAPGCSAAVPVQIGSKLKVTEAVPADEVASVPVGGIVTAFSGSTATIKTTAGANVVTFEDEPVGPPQNGYIELCKDAYDDFVNGSYHFDIYLGANNTSGQPFTSADVLVGQCTTPIQVPAGPVTVVEGANKSTELYGVWTDPSSALGVVNLDNQTAVVVVPVAPSPDDTSQEVQVHFINKTLTATLKVCKLLPAGSEALAGSTFKFDVTDSAIVDEWGNPEDIWVSVTAAAGSSGACKIVGDTDGYGRFYATQFPVGSTVKAVESGTPFVSGDGGASGAKDTQSTPSGQIVGGINTITFTNTALGQLEICKDVVDGYGLVPFTISYTQVDGSAKGSVTVDDGTCSLPQVVPAGNYTISETQPTVKLANGTVVPAYQFVASDARGPLGENRCVPVQNTPANATGHGASTQYNLNQLAGAPITNCGMPFTVSVPYFNNSDPLAFGETQVEIWNKAVEAQLKICKQVTSDSTAALSSVGFDFLYQVDNHKPVTLRDPVYPGTCTGLLDIGQIATGTSTDTHGNTILTPAEITVAETGPTNLGCGFHVNAVTLTGGSPISGSNSYNKPNGGFGNPGNFGNGNPVNGLDGQITYDVEFNPGPGTNVVTFWNQSEQCDT